MRSTLRSTIETSVNCWEPRDRRSWFLDNQSFPGALNASLICQSKLIDPRGSATHTAIWFVLRNCPLVHAGGQSPLPQSRRTKSQFANLECPSSTQCRGGY
jgi:hypothetical protein